jgi:hypothetical protein
MAGGLELLHEISTGVALERWTEHGRMVSVIESSLMEA